MYPTNKPEGRPGVSATLEFLRRRPREDDTRMTAAQLMDRGMVEYGKLAARAISSEQPWPTREPRVRMDIQTAVQIASLSDYPLGLVELLTDTAPATPVPAHETPCMANVAIDSTVSEAVNMGRRYRDRLNTRIRQAREARRLDADIARSSAFVARMLRDEKIARVIIWACGGVAGALLVTLVVWLV